MIWSVLIVNTLNQRKLLGWLDTPLSSERGAGRHLMDQCQECRTKVQHKKPAGRKETFNEAELQMD